MLYLESGDYHSYTFVVDKENVLPLQNITFSLNDDGTYDSYLLTYDITQQELEAINSGVSLNLDNKTNVELLDLESDDYINKNSTSGAFRCSTVITESCNVVDTCDWGGSVHVAGPGCTQVNGTSLVCTPVSVISNCPGSGEGDSNSNSGGGGGSSGNSTIDPNDPIDVTVPCEQVPGGQGIEIGNGECASGSGLTSPFTILNLSPEEQGIIGLNSQTRNENVKNRIVELQGMINTSTTEQGSEFKTVNGTLIDFPVSVNNVGYNFTRFPPVSSNTKIRMHLHQNTETENSDGSLNIITPIYSEDDVLATIRDFIGIENTSATMQDALEFSSIVVTRQGLLAMKITSPSDALAFITAYENESLFNDDGNTYKEIIDRIYENIQTQFDQNCNNGNTSCTEEVENIFYLKYFLSFINKINAGITLYSSISTDSNGNPIWQIVD